MLLKVLYFCLGISFHAIQADIGLPPSDKLAGTTVECPSAQTEVLDYRWENYTFTPPEDAFKIHYFDRKTKYIRQVEIPGVGKCLDIFQTYEIALYVTCNGYHRITENIKILCVGHQEYYEWKKTNNEEEFRAVLKNNELVKGGYNETKKVDTFVGLVETNAALIGDIDKEEGTIRYGNMFGAEEISRGKDLTIYILTYKPTEEPPKEKPNNSDIPQKGVDSTQVRVGVDCLDVEVQTPSEINPSAPSPNLPPQTTINSEPTEQAQTLDYRWENYNGTPPEDAFGIHYFTHKTEYIGQVEIPGAGKCIGLLQADEVKLQVSCNGYYEVTENIKILCVGHEEYYEWKTTNTEEEFRAVLKNNELVKGGYNETKKVDTFVGAHDTAPLYIGNVDKEEGTLSYGRYVEEIRSVKDDIDDTLKVLIYKPTEEPPKEKPNCSDLLQKGVDLTQVRVGIDCLDVEVQTPSEINPSAPSPNLPNVKLPSQTKVESNPTAKINVG